MRVPDRFDVEPIVGWRYWFISVHTTDLASSRLESPVLPNFKWPAGEKAVARCVEHEEDAPLVDCACGLHAASNLNLLRVPIGSPRTMVAVGQVSIWGHIAEHELGWRAQYAYPYSLELRPLFSGTFSLAEKIARELRAAYVVDTEVRYPNANR